MALSRFTSIILLLSLSLSLFVPTTSAAAIPNPPMARTNCTDKCGNISIPFPFGIGSGLCFLNTTFEVVCENNTIPKLKSHNLEVISITLPRYNPYYTNGSINGSVAYKVNGEVTVKASIVYNNCADKEPGKAMSVRRSPFYFSKKKNVFASVGCNNLAIFDGAQSLLVGCTSVCSGTTVSNRFGECSGFECCQTSIQSGLQDYSTDFKLNDENGVDGCRYAFLAEQQWFRHNFQDLNALQNMDFVPLVLDWTVEETDLNALGLTKRGNYSTVYSCDIYSVPSRNTSTPPLYTCFCNRGYIGNALLGNCQDINECEDSELNNCVWECSNTEGSYRCKGRSRVVESVFMGSGIGLVVILLAFLVWWVRKIVKRRNDAKLKEKLFKRNGGLLLEQQQISAEANYVEKTKLFGSEVLN